MNWSKFDQFNLIYLKINSLRNKLYDIEEIVNRNNIKIIHFIVLTETRIYDSETKFFNIPNYKSYFRIRNDGHGGAELFIHNSLDSNLTASDIEFKINYVIVNIPAIKTSIPVLYKKPTFSLDKFLTVLNKIIDSTNKVILICDMNLDIQANNNNINKYLTAVNAAGCCILNNREKNLPLFRMIKSAKTRCIQTREVSLKFNPHKLWVNDDLISLIRERNRYSKLSKKFPLNLFAKKKFVQHCQLVRAK